MMPEVRRPRWRQLLAARLARGLSLSAVGPNEARILFDVIAATGASLVTAWLGAMAGVTAVRWPVWAVAASQTAMFLGGNAALGLYSRHRASPVGFRLRCLAGSILLGCGVGWVAGGEVFVPAAWAAILLPPVLLTRWTASIARSNARPLRRLVTDPHAPIAVLGGAGYIGTHVVAELLARGYRVRVLDRLMYGTEPLQEFLGDPRFQLVTGDVTDIARLTETVNGCRAVVHLAGLVGDPACAVDPDYTLHTNIVATRLAHEVAHSLGVSRFVFASSCSVYGLADSEVDELSPLNPVSLYARTKIDSARAVDVEFGRSRRAQLDVDLDANP